MNRIKNYLAIAIAVAGFGFSSCSNDDDDNTVEQTTVDVTNTELKAVLQQKGFNFNAEGKLIQDDKVKSATTLDLSNCNLTDVSGLEVFPNLTDVNLSNNKFTTSFDFSKLPASVTGVDLTGNEIYEYKGLVNVETAENGNETVTVLHPLAKLYLPKEAKYDCNELVYFYENNKDVDMKMIDSSENLIAYNTLREVIDDDARTQLKELFPDFFEGEYINIAKRVVDATEKTRSLTVKASNVEGFEYILFHRDYRGSYIEINDTDETPTLLPFCKIKSLVSSFDISNIDTSNGIDFSNAENIVKLAISKNPSIEIIDITNSKLMGQREINIEYNTLAYASSIVLQQCSKLKTLLLPEKMVKLSTLNLIDLPIFEDIDLSKFEAMSVLRLALLPKTKITYFSPQYYLYGNKVDNEKGKIKIGISQDIYDKKETQDFLKEYHKKCSFTSLFLDGKAIAYHWELNYSN